MQCDWANVLPVRLGQGLYDLVYLPPPGMAPKCDELIQRQFRPFFGIDDVAAAPFPVSGNGSDFCLGDCSQSLPVIIRRPTCALKTGRCAQPGFNSMTGICSNHFPSICQIALQNCPTPESDGRFLQMVPFGPNVSIAFEGGGTYATSSERAGTYVCSPPPAQLLLQRHLL